MRKSVVNDHLMEMRPCVNFLINSCASPSYSHRFNPLYKQNKSGSMFVTAVAVLIREDRFDIILYVHNLILMGMACRHDRV